MIHLLALSADSKMVLTVLFCAAMLVVVALFLIIHWQDKARPRASTARPAVATPTPPRAAMPAAGDGSFPPAAAAILHADPSARIAAIKAYREATGQGLKESKDAVEAWLAGHPVAVPTPPAPAPGFPPAVVDLLRANPNNKIQAIKVYREATGSSLLAAKNAVEAWMDANG